MKLLLICPAFQESFWTFRMIQDELFPQIQSNVAPLGLASVAALTPPHWDVTIVDENVEEIPWDAEVDLVGVCGMSNQVRRQSEIVKRFRERGCFVVVGGNHASLQPEHYEDLVDCVVAGESELTWPQFCADFEQGVSKALYQETGNIELESCPVPRFDLLKMDRYHYAALQFSRGCPFRCEFCDIIVTFGRIPKTPLWDRLQSTDRLRESGSLLDGGDNTRPSTNVIPLRMSYQQMVDEHTALWKRLFEPAAIFERIRNKFQALQEPLVTYYLCPANVPQTFLWFLVRPLWRAGPTVWWYFLRSLWFTQGKYPRITALVDTWARTLALKEFSSRIFGELPTTPSGLTAGKK